MTITFSEAVSGLTNDDLTIANGTLTAVSSGDGGVTWTATFTPSVDTTEASNLITLDNTGVSDGAGNTGAGDHRFQQLRDRHAASDGHHRGGGRRAAGGRDLAGDDHLQRGGERADQRRSDDRQRHADGGVVGDGGVTWTATFTPSVDITEATNLITLDNTGVTDLAGNTGAGDHRFEQLRDRHGASDGYHRRGGQRAEGRRDLAGDDHLQRGGERADQCRSDDRQRHVDGGVVGDGGVTWTATFTPTVDTTEASNLITLDNTGVSDGAGNTGMGTTDSNNYAIDTLRPTATIVVADDALRAGESSLVTITFSEAVSGLTNADLTIANGTLTAVSSGDGGVTWTATFTPSVDTTEASNLITLDNTGVSDGAGNTGLGTTDSNGYVIDIETAGDTDLAQRGQ